jgi:hypothetical protein
MGVAAISYDPVPVLADFSRRRGITFPLLSDAGSAVIKDYRILNTTVPPTNQQQYGIPFPGTFLVDQQGIVASRVFEAAYQERDSITSVLVRLGGHVDTPAIHVAAAHLQVTSYATDQTVAPGTHFSLVIDVAPAKRVHVYAPGATGYQPIALTVEPQPGLVLRGSQFPQAEDYFFKPLNEHVPVYPKPFRIVQDLMIDASRDAEAALRSAPSLTIKGSLTYQACDDKVCFIPQSVPLTWTVALKPLDRERAKVP